MTDGVERDWSDGDKCVIVILTALGFENKMGKLVMGQFLKTVAEISLMNSNYGKHFDEVMDDVSV